MDISDSLELIKSFYKGSIEFGRIQDLSKSAAIEKEKNVTLPPEFKQYIDNFIPLSDVYFTGVGNPLEIHCRARISWLMDGYNYNFVLNETIDDWDENWFIFADEGADPVIVKLNEQEQHSVVYKAMHGAGEWEFEPIADSIGQFLICAAAVDHALTGFDHEDAIIDDESGFNLVQQSAEWLFPFIKQQAGHYYEHWVSVFDNC